jgi:hypothetical protein
LEIVGRELELGSAQLESHLARLEPLGLADDAALAEAIRDGRVGDDPSVRQALRADARDRLLVADPAWLPPESA